jgi:hypothetical protein
MNEFKINYQLILVFLIIESHLLNGQYTNLPSPYQNIFYFSHNIPEQANMVDIKSVLSLSSFI